MSKDASRSERKNTDDGLRTERSNADDALDHTRASVQRAADGVVTRARKKADAVLVVARDKADRKLTRARKLPESGSTVALQRAAEDATLEGERAAADQSLGQERAEQARILLELLPLEREKTDRYLLIERVRSDDSIANRDDFLGIVSHDLRNLLGSIALSAQVLATQASSNDEGKRTVTEATRIQRYIARMNRIVGDLVDVVSIDAGRLAMQPQQANANTLILEAVDTFAHSAQKKGITLLSTTTQRHLDAIFDHHRMFQVLANLIANAIKFSPAGSVIEVCGERKAGHLLVSVSDTGVGIPVERLEAVFERFWQVGQQDHRGLGLGLYISKCIVDAHGGRIWVESKLGEGSRFYFSIPEAAARRKKSAPG